MELELSKFVTQLQSLAHDGYALHKIVIHSKCDSCEADTILTDPDVTLKIDETTKSVILKFENKEKNISENQ